MNGASAGVGCDVIGKDAEDAAIEERVLEGDAVEHGAFEARDFLCVWNVDGGFDRFGQFGGDDVHIASHPCLRQGWGTHVHWLAGFERDVVEVRMEGNGERRGQRPRRCRPDDGKDVLAFERGRDCFRRACQLVAHVHGGAGVLLVLDLSLGKCSAVMDAPVDGLETAVDEAFLEEAVKGFESACFVVARHGLIGPVPAAKDADALELRGLQVNVFLGVGTAGLKDGRRGHFKLLAAELLIDFDLDGKAVTVEAGDIRGVEAGHSL